MRPVRSTIAAAGITAAITAALLAVGAGTANAANCVGFPDQPATYVCLESLTPQNATPDVDTSGGTVTVPMFCYYVGCTEDTPIDTPSVSPGEGSVAVVTYNGQTYTVPADPTQL